MTLEDYTAAGENILLPPADDEAPDLEWINERPTAEQIEQAKAAMSNLVD